MAATSGSSIFAPDSPALLPDRLWLTLGCRLPPPFSARSSPPSLRATICRARLRSSAIGSLLLSAGFSWLLAVVAVVALPALAR